PTGVAINPDRLGNVRAALQWSFSPTGDIGLGTRLAAVAALLYIELCLLNECERGSERALTALNEETQDPGARWFCMQRSAMCACSPRATARTRGRPSSGRLHWPRSSTIAPMS